MVQPSKYATNDPDFDREHDVLRNKLGITDQAELEYQEKIALVTAYEHAPLQYSDSHRFTAKDVCDLHQLFLGKIFKWAGNYRKVDISSEGIHWCHAQHIATQMQEYEKRLARLTPFLPTISRKTLLESLAELHGELIAIHPFRDGNGRTVRLLCDLLLMQAGRPPVQAGMFDDQKIRHEYHVAIREILNHVNYQPLIQLLDRLVE